MKKIVLSFLLINVILWTLDIGFEMFINNLYYLIYISIGLILVSVGLSIWIIIKKRYIYLLVTVLTTIVNSILLFLAYAFKDGIL